MTAIFPLNVASLAPHAVPVSRYVSVAEPFGGATDPVSLASARTIIIGTKEGSDVRSLGTGIILDDSGLIATAYHVISGCSGKLVALLRIRADSLGYQDLTQTNVQADSLQVVAVDPFRDIAICQSHFRWNGSNIPKIADFDDTRPSDVVHVFGFPHCIFGRMAVTFEKTEVGAKVIVSNRGIKSRHAVINTQARPGQSGSPVIHPQTGALLGMLIGAWVPEDSAPPPGGLNVAELHQTTHCISGSHIREML